MKAVAAFLWMATLACVLGLLFTISNDRAQLDQVTKDRYDVEAQRDKVVEDLKDFAALQAEFHNLRPAPLVLRPIRVKVAEDGLGQRVVTGSQRDVVGFVDDVLAQGYPAGELTIVPRAKKWQATLRLADTIHN